MQRLQGQEGRVESRSGRSAAHPPCVVVAALTRHHRAIVRSLPIDAWARLRVTEGEKGPREYEFVRLRVVEKAHREPGAEGWLMARRPMGSDRDADIKCYLSNFPVTVALAEMAAVGCLRWTIEEDFALAKGEVGLDPYEVTATGAGISTSRSR